MERSSPVLCGANPCVFLYDNQDHICAALSLWEVDYSEFGSGLCAFLSTGVGAERRELVFYERLELAIALRSHFNRHFEGFNGIGDEHCTAHHSSFLLHRQGAGDLSIEARAETFTLAGSWEKPHDPTIIPSRLTGFGPRAETSFDVCATIIPCTTGEITLDGNKLDGQLNPNHGGFGSSAFLACAETWTRRP